ncbi:hypothetical protein RND81_09G130800 [Saponaria officinalis]|uniref:Uncharacterized protein n=1 Tax=Saponaria officinalis TaxID=3572 RepID=A0AAW1ILI3_SAPOF
MFGAKSSLFRYSKRFLNLHHRRSFCNNSTSLNNNNKNPQNLQSYSINGGIDSKFNDRRDLDAYRDLDKLDFMKAAKILFSSPPKKKKFGLDFHLVQLFFALMPSFAVYLVAKYSRYEMKRMEAELEVKKKAEEEAKAKQMEAAAADETEPESNSELLKVKERLEALEETVKEIAVETKKRSSDDKSRSAGQSQEKVGAKRSSEDIHGSDKNQTSNQATVQTPKQEDSENKGSHGNEKK